MAEEEWVEAPAPPPEKRGVPGWLWFCGGGCLIAVVLAIVGGFFLWDVVKDAIDPDKQWPKFEEFVQFDERPTEWNIIGIPNPFPGVEAFTLADSEENSMTLLVFPDGQREEADNLFSGELEGSGVSGVSKIENVEEGEVVVQGRTLPIVTFTQSHFMDAMDGLQGAFVDLTPEGGTRPLLLQIMRQDRENRVSEELLTEWLAPFHIGPDR